MVAAAHFDRAATVASQGTNHMALDLMGAALALHRFGLGPRAGSISAIASDPRGAVLAELARSQAGQVAGPDLQTSGAENRAVFEWNAERLARQRVEQRRRREAMQDGMQNPEMAAEPPPEADPAAREVPLPQQIFLREAKARFDAAFAAEIGFVERLVWFWSNHFCVSFDNTVMAGAYEREAIRPHALGRFVDLLLAAEGHPAMLLYLNNAASIGPNSVAGINRERGLNENLAREILELHTLGVRTIYDQADVTNFAKVLTGWTIFQTATNPDRGGEFLFNSRLHEPGPQTVIGKVYADGGVGQGRAVLTDLARQPQTAQHVAVKLARHFVADEPPPVLVELLARRFTDTDGDLKEVATALVTAPESWAPERGKIKRPGEWIAATRRATGLPGDVRRTTRAMLGLGEPLWRPPAPKGFSDDSAVWLDGLPQRLAIANLYAQNVAERVDTGALVDTALGPLASTETRRAVATAESKPQALALFLMAPEFQRR
jgi:uncharacterized protein (DUF1800 family)